MEDTRNSLILTDAAKVKPAIRQVMITYDALGLDHSFDGKDHKFIQREKQKKNQEQKKQISEINEVDDVELFPPSKRSKQSGGFTVTKKVTTSESVKRKKEIKFMWTSHRKLMLV